MGRNVVVGIFLSGVVTLGTCSLWAEEAAPQTDGEVWNEGVEYYRAGDVTNALRVLRPLMLSKTHGPRAAEVVAKLEFERGNQEEAAAAAQAALRAAPEDAQANRNFTRAVNGLAQRREKKHFEDVLKAAQGKDPGGLLLAATKDVRRMLPEADGCRTNEPALAVAQADALSAQAERLADAWIPVRELIAQSVTNQEQAAMVMAQVEQARTKTLQAAKELGDLRREAGDTLSTVEESFTRFLKLTVLPPAAVDEGIVSQSNAWMDVEAFNGRPWQPDALDYTQAFRAKFPAWARAYEQQAQADTNNPPFTKEDQAKVSALATEVEKLQLECVEKSLPPNQEKALELLRQIRELLPKDKNGGGQQNPQQNPQQPPPDQKQDQQDQQKKDQQQPPPQTQPDQQEQKEAEQKPEEKKEDKDIEATLKKAQERNDEHEAKKREQNRQMRRRTDERDW